MCGICGTWSSALGTAASIAAVERMMATMVARGPDGAGTWASTDRDPVLGHRRLAVVDASAAGIQPMSDHSGRWTISFNGEIYNHLELRSELVRQGPIDWRGHSDTETLVECIRAWGLTETLRKAHGMFAFAAWDARDRALFLVRDRLGEKPLFYGLRSNTLAFGSTARAVVAHPAFLGGGGIDPAAVASVLRCGCIHGEVSAYRWVRRLPPGAIVRFDESTLGSEAWPEPTRWWSIPARAPEAAAVLDDGSAKTALRDLLRRTVGEQLVADVAVGAFLSAGIDSSLIVAVMRELAGSAVRTYTIGFRERDYDESGPARRIAEHLGTHHSELVLDADEACERASAIPAIYDEPFADSSQIPTLLVSEFARREVTVALSGDGGDELFGGYNRHVWAHRTWPLIERMPMGFRSVVGSAIERMPSRAWDAAIASLPSAASRRIAARRPGERARKLAAMLRAGSVRDAHDAVRAIWEQEPMRERPIPSTERAGTMPALAGMDPAHAMMLLDLHRYLPDDILVKLDRAAMSVSLETRAPFLDARIVEFAWQLPLRMKLRNGTGKWITRELLSDYVPRELLDRPKSGFGIPLAAWLRGPMRAWADRLLAEDRLESTGFLCPRTVRAAWSSHLGGRADHSQRIWTVLMLQGWLEQQGAAA